MAISRICMISGRWGTGRDGCCGLRLSDEFTRPPDIQLRCSEKNNLLNERLRRAGLRPNLSVLARKACSLTLAIGGQQPGGEALAFGDPFRLKRDSLNGNLDTLEPCGEGGVRPTS